MNENQGTTVSCSKGKQIGKYLVLPVQTDDRQSKWAAWGIWRRLGVKSLLATLAAAFLAALFLASGVLGVSPTVLATPLSGEQAAAGKQMPVPKAKSTTKSKHQASGAALLPIIRPISYEVADGLPKIAQTIRDAAGNTYHLDVVGQAHPANGIEQQRIFEVVAWRDVDIATYQGGERALRKAFPLTSPIDEQGFKGQVDLLSVKADAVYASRSEQLEKQLIYPGLKSEDIQQLPDAAEFVVSSDAAPDATTQAVLKRLGVTWQVTDRAANGRPIEFEATVTFRGSQKLLVLDHYRASARYRGKVPAVRQMMTVEARYLPDARTVATQPLPATLTPPPAPEPPRPLVAEVPPEAALPEATLPPAAVQSQQPEVDPVYPVVQPVPETEPLSIPWPTVLPLTATAVVMCALLFLLYFLLRPDARLVRIDHGSRYEVLAAKRLRLQAGVALFELPFGFDLSDINTSACILLEGKRYRRAMRFELRHQGRLLFCDIPQPQIAVGLKLASMSAEMLLDKEQAPVPTAVEASGCVPLAQAGGMPIFQKAGTR
ncbi:MAG: hypothetical protein FWF71_05530 [Actinomycetia bacterium]|nr:hypothetical protein [Actinomycetes bacterium]